MSTRQRKMKGTYWAGPNFIFSSTILSIPITEGEYKNIKDVRKTQNNIQITLNLVILFKLNILIYYFYLILNQLTFKYVLLIFNKN